MITWKTGMHFRFWKNIDKIEVGIFLQTSFFEVKLFKKSYKIIFCGVYAHVQNIWKFPPPHTMYKLGDNKNGWCFEMKPKLKLEYSEKKNHFLWCETFLKTPTTFSVDLTNMFTISGKCNKHRSLRLWKNCDRTTHQYDSVSGEVKKLKFWKMKSKVRFSWNILTNLNFWGETFSQRSR